MTKKRIIFIYFTGNNLLCVQCVDFITLAGYFNRISQAVAISYLENEKQKIY